MKNYHSGKHISLRNKVNILGVFVLQLLCGTSSAQNVGIGTSTPQQKLHVNGTARMDSNGVSLQLVGNTGGNTFMAIYPQGIGAGRMALIGFDANGTTELSISNEATGGATKISTNSLDRIYVANNGNVGIGTNLPTTLLDVVGDERVGISEPRYTGPTSFNVPGPSYSVNFIQSFTWAGNSHLYVLFSVSGTINWIQSQEVARIVKGHLATVTSSEENDFIRTNILSLPAAQGNVAIGHTDALTEGRWECITGEIAVLANNLTYRYWYPGEPNNLNQEDVAHYLSASSDVARRWNDLDAIAVAYTCVLVEFEYVLRP